MSNCLDLRNETVVFRVDEIDLPTLKTMLEQSKPDDKDNFINPTKYLVAWFLVANTEVTDTSATVRFGFGNSSHTFRDFRGTINQIFKPLMKRSKRHIFIARDAENPQTGWFKWPVDFQQGVQ